jgi:hypothetical protein
MEEVIFFGMKLAFSLALVGILSWIFYIYGTLWYNSQRVRRKLRMQGIRGPPPSSFLHGNLPDMQRITSRASNISKDNDQFLAYDYSAALFPYFQHWRKQYGIYTLIFFHSSFSSFIITPPFHNNCDFTIFFLKIIGITLEYQCSIYYFPLIYPYLLNFIQLNHSTKYN